METIRFLGADDAPALLDAFNEAFADYAVDVRMDEARFRDLLARRAVRLDLSVGAFSGGRIVAFLANGFASWRGAPSAYDSGTGVVRAFRGRGLAARTFDFAAPRLAAEGARRYVLEVLASNEPALRIYRAKGFAPTRRLLCFEAGRATVAARPAAGVVVREAPGLDAAFAAASGDFAPSWQNTSEALARSLAPRTTLEAFLDGRRAGCAVVVPSTGDLPLLAVERGFRGRGAGSALLAAAARAAGARPLRAINVDAAAAETARFLRARGFAETAAQFEMELPLG